MDGGGEQQAAHEADGVASPPPEEVRAQLERVVASAEFAVPERARRMLRYVVEEALAGRGARIKAYTIAVEVFGRDDTFDANADPAVRLEAGRLRRALERYYLVGGQADPVLIGIPKGGYVPAFTARALPPTVVAPGSEPPADPPAPPPADPADAPPRRSWKAAAAAVLLAAIAYVLGISSLALLRPRTGADTGAVASGGAPARLPAGPILVVIPLVDLGEGPGSTLYAAGLGEELLTQLASFKELTVLGRETSRGLRPGAGTLALVAYMLGDTRRAVAEIRRADLDKLSFFHGIAAIVYAEAGMGAEAAAAARRFAALNPGFLADPEAELVKRNYRPGDRARVIEGLRKAGLPVPATVAAGDRPRG